MLEKALKEFQDPYLGANYLDLGAAKVLSQDKGTAQLEITLPYPLERKGLKAELEDKLKQTLKKHGVDKVKLSFVFAAPQINPRPHVAVAASNTPANQLGQVKNIIVIGSGKGGVGKSTVSTFIASSLSKLGAKVGLLDADIYGPSQPELLQAEAKREELAGSQQNTMKPVMAHSMKTMSLHYLLDKDKSPTIWRGAMASNALQQMLFQTEWGELDYLVIDMPPGTGDIQLTLCQRASISAAIIITTPHQLAVMGAKKGLQMFQRLYVPVLGVIENMSYYNCPKCKSKHYLFGKDVTKKELADAKLLAEVPIEESYNTKIALDKNIPEFWQDLAFSVCVDLAKLDVQTPPEIKVVND